MRAIAIIPARGGSKRIPGKNIRPFLGKAIIGYSIETALRSGFFSEVMVSTDSDEIADISRSFGAHVPFLRSPATSGDHAIIAEVLSEVLGEYSRRGEEFEFACCLLPTCPLLGAGDLGTAYEKLRAGGFDCVFPICRFSYPIWRSLKRDGDKVLMNWPENYSKRSQDLPVAFHDCGQFYWFRVDRFRASSRLFTENTGSIELPDSQVQDIDSEEDWRICELKYQFLHRGTA